MDTQSRLGRRALAELDDNQIVIQLDLMQPDDAARILRKLPAKRRGQIKAMIAQDRRAEIARLSDYSEEFAGGLMNSRYADLDPDTNCGDAVRQLAAEDEAESIYIAFVIDADHRLLGSVSMRDLLRADKAQCVRDAMVGPIDPISVDMPAEDAARLVSQSGQAMMPVVDVNNRLIGIISQDDAFRQLESEATEDMERFAAVAGESDRNYLNVPIWQDFRRRAPWILSLAIVGLLAGYVVHIYEDALDVLVILALYMPMVADTGGNVGTQTSGLLIRSIATGNIALNSGLSVLWRELRVSLLLALMLFAFAWLKVVFFSNSADIPQGLTLELIALAIGVAIAVQVVVSAVIGACLPLIALATRQDPAIMAGPALTTVVDTTGLLMYFMITTSILGI
ncbi:MAG: magnesium transporter [Stappiaceae bacterium]